MDTSEPEFSSFVICCSFTAITDLLCGIRLVFLHRLYPVNSRSLRDNIVFDDDHRDVANSYKMLDNSTSCTALICLTLDRLGLRTDVYFVFSSFVWSKSVFPLNIPLQ